MRLLLTLPLLLSSGFALPAQAQRPYVDPLAATGRMATAACPEPEIVQGGIPRTREYLTAITKCLDKSWSKHLAGTRRTFRKPIVRYYDEPAPRVCGLDWPEGAAAFYCTERATLVFPLTGRWIEDRTDLYPLKVAAHEYGHHVQSLTGIRKHYESAAARAGRARQAELGRRYELQADCLSGVFLGSVWGSLGRGRGDWESLLDATRASGDDDGERRSHGKGANRAYWLKRGFTTQRPGSCDTWAAPPARVA